jgi:hypothetical protein
MVSQGTGTQQKTDPLPFIILPLWGPDQGPEQGLGCRGWRFTVADIWESLVSSCRVSQWCQKRHESVFSGAPYIFWYFNAFHHHPPHSYLVKVRCGHAFPEWIMGQCTSSLSKSSDSIGVSFRHFFDFFWKINNILSQIPWNFFCRKTMKRKCKKQKKTKNHPQLFTTC